MNNNQINCYTLSPASTSVYRILIPLFIIKQSKQNNNKKKHHPITLTQLDQLTFAGNNVIIDGKYFCFISKRKRTYLYSCSEEKKMKIITTIAEAPTFTS